MAEKRFLGKVATRLIYPASQNFHRNRSILHRFQDKCTFAFYTKIQDGCQKCGESCFCEMLAVYSADTLRVKTFNEIALSRTVSKINVKCWQYILQILCR